MAQPSTGSAMRTLLGLLLGLSLSSVMSMPGAPPDYPPIEPSGMLSSNTSMMYEPEQGEDADMSYCQKLLEAPIPPPADQVPWFCICFRCKGTLGPKGDRGDRGLPGSPGSPGRRGLTGFRGHPGFVGRQGIKGEKGDEGLKGDKGPLGFSGAKGERGFKGDKGDHGLDGPSGEQGPKGDEGHCPDKCDAVQGPPGQLGLPGPAGARGLPGLEGSVGAIGPRGDTGDMGDPGAPGADGQKGEQGAEGECICQDGVHGLEGQQGPQGEQGDVGEVGPQGEKGEAGEKGDMGDMGMMGIPGPCSSTIQSAFSVALDTIFPAPNMPVVFSRVIYNMQGHYNPQSGLYTAPANGAYIFSYHLSVFGRVLKVGLFHNFVPVVKTTESAELGTTSHQVVLDLNMGDRVWLQVKDTTNNGMYASPEASSTFSGYLLHADSCEMPMLRSNLAFPLKGDYIWGDIPDSTPAP